MASGVAVVYCWPHIFILSIKGYITVELKINKLFQKLEKRKNGLLLWIRTELMIFFLMCAFGLTLLKKLQKNSSFSLVF